MSQTIYLVSGSNRGIGLGLVKELARNPANVIYAGARDPSKASELQGLASQYPDRFYVVKLVSADEAGNRGVAQEIQAKYGRVDIVIANAGISKFVGTVEVTTADTVRENFEVNYIGPLVLFQAMLPLLKASKSPMFIPITSRAASSKFASFALGSSCYTSVKAALNSLAQAIHFEYEWLVCFPLAPGIVRTDMARAVREMDKSGRLAARQDAALISPEEGATKMIELLSKATREEQGGKFINIDGSIIPW